MKKILVIGLSDNIGGVETFFHTYYEKFDLKKYHFDFVTVCDTIAFGDEYSARGSEIFKLPSFMKKPLSYYCELKRIMRKNKYDIVHINMLSAANILPIKAAQKEKISSILIHSHNSNTPSGLLRKLLHLVNKGFVRRSESVKLACGLGAGKWLFGKESRFYIINNAIDVKKFKFNRSDRVEIRNEYKIRDEDFLLGNVGRLCEQKNQSFLIDVLAKLEKYDKVKLILVGSGIEQEKIIKKAKNLNVLDKLTIVKNIPDVNKYYSAFDLFVFPSIFEGMPIAPIEAQANGLKCLISDKITDEVDQGGVSYSCLDIVEWADKILKEMVEEEHSKRKANIKDSYDVNKQFLKLTAIYEWGALQCDDKMCRSVL